MAATVIAETDAMEVSSLCVLIFGPPGSFKTSLAQTAEAPVTFDFDKGIHRAWNRKTAVRFESWADVAAVSEGSAVMQGRRTIVIDTVGRMLDLMTAEIIRTNPKHGSAAGGLTLQGFGALRARFAYWLGQVRTGGRDVVMIAHEKEEKDGDERFFRPDIQGGSYSEVMKLTDLVGYLSLDRQGRRVLDFNPSDRHLGKNAAGWDPIQLPNLKERTSFLAELLADAKDRIGKTAEASAAVAREVEKWQALLAGVKAVEALNNSLPDLKEIGHEAAKKQVWHLFLEHARANGWAWDKAAKVFKGAA